MSEKINETEVEKVSPELDPEERLDCIFTFNGMKIVNHIDENNFDNCELIYKDGTLIKFEELANYGVFTFDQLKMVIDTKFPDVVTKVQIARKYVLN
jgi:hypothetical protein